MVACADVLALRTSLHAAWQGGGIALRTHECIASPARFSKVSAPGGRRLNTSALGRACLQTELDLPPERNRPMSFVRYDLPRKVPRKISGARIAADAGWVLAADDVSVAAAFPSDGDTNSKPFDQERRACAAGLSASDYAAQRLAHFLNACALDSNAHLAPAAAELRCYYPSADEATAAQRAFWRAAQRSVEHSHNRSDAYRACVEGALFNEARRRPVASRLYTRVWPPYPPHPAAPLCRCTAPSVRRPSRPPSTAWAACSTPVTPQRCARGDPGRTRSRRRWPQAASPSSAFAWTSGGGSRAASTISSCSRSRSARPLSEGRAGGATCSPKCRP